MEVLLCLSEHVLGDVLCLARHGLGDELSGAQTHHVVYIRHLGVSLRGDVSHRHTHTVTWSKSPSKPSLFLASWEFVGEGRGE